MCYESGLLCVSVSVVKRQAVIEIEADVTLLCPALRPESESARALHARSRFIRLH